MTARLGQSVTVDGVTYVITSPAPGSGWWGMVPGTNTFVRLLEHPWRVKVEGSR